MQAHQRARTFLWVLAGILGIVAADQIVKQRMLAWIGPDASHHRREVFGRAFAFEYLENRGAAFGLFQTATPILASVSVVAVVIGLFIIWRAIGSDRWLAVAVGLIVAGAAGNAIDRVARGYVVDYIAIGRFWKFNLADSAVTIGAVLAFIVLMLAERKQKPEQDLTS